MRGWQAIILLGMLFTGVSWIFGMGIEHAEAARIAESSHIKTKSLDDVMDRNTKLEKETIAQEAIIDAQKAELGKAPEPTESCPANCSLTWPPKFR